jgi:predicted alpha/beta superfamily hydrolase
MNMMEYGNSGASVVLIQPIGEHELPGIEHEVDIIRNNTNIDFRLLAFKVNNWNKDLSPWKAPAVFGNDDFGESAMSTLKEILSHCEDKSKRYVIGGYSLAGLFSIWSAYQTDVFSGVAAASPSIWFPGFKEYMEKKAIKSRTVYLSLGDKEEKTRNPVMAKVGERIHDAYDIIHEAGVNCIFEWNSGNHFKDAELRTAKAFSWVINNSLCISKQ